MKKQSKLMTFLMSLLLVFMLAVPGNAVSTQADTKNSAEKMKEIRKKFTKETASD